MGKHVGYAVISYRARLSTLTASPWAGILVSPSQLRLDSRIALSFLPIPCRASAKALCGSQGALSPFASRSHRTGECGWPDRRRHVHVERFVNRQCGACETQLVNKWLLTNRMNRSALSTSANIQRGNTEI